MPAISGTLVKSFVKKTAGNVDLEDEIHPVPQKPVQAATATGVPGGVRISFNSVAGADSYEIYGTSPDLTEDFTDTPLTVNWVGPTEAVVPGERSNGSRLFAISTVDGGVHTMNHAALTATAGSGSTCDYGPRRPADTYCDGMRLGYSFENQGMRGGFAVDAGSQAEDLDDDDVLTDQVLDAVFVDWKTISGVEQSPDEERSFLWEEWTTGRASALP